MAALNEQVFASQVYNFMETAYRTGLLEKGSRIMGEVVDEVLQETNTSMSQLVNTIDSIKEQTVLNFEKTIISVRFILPLMVMGNGRLFAFASRMLDFAIVEKIFRMVLKFVLSGNASPAKIKANVSGFIARKAHSLKCLLNL